MANQEIDDKPSLPKEYMQLEYLECTGPQYIDVPVAWKDINSITVTCQTTGTIGNTNQAVLGSKIGASATQCWGIYTSGALKDWQWSTGIDPYLKITANLFTIINDNAVSGASGSIIIADTQEVKNTAYSGFVPNDNLQLFATNNSGRRFFGKIFHVAINTKTIELIPTLRIADSKPGMYDLVSGQFFVNQGTGEFSYG